MEPTIYRLAQVFVVGKQPTITYSAREGNRFELILGDYLEERGRVLVVTGPSKSGKTVLLRHSIPDAIWLAGGQIEDVAQFWRRIVDQVGGWTGESKGMNRSDTESAELGGNLALKPGGVGAESQAKTVETVTDTSNHQRSVERDVQSVGMAVLASSEQPLIIDDFHHMAPGLQRAIVRHIKPLIDQNLAVIFAAVPHHAADAVMAENEMESRVESLQLGLWNEAELGEIADKGFAEALGVDPATLPPAKAWLTRSSFRSPHLMQLLCRELAKANELRQTAPQPFALRIPSDRAAFLADLAVRYTDDQIYRDLVRGPQSRKDRVERRLKASGQMTDIYGAVMAAIQLSGPAEELPYNTLRDHLRELLDTLPQKEQITNTLKHMTAIAEKHAMDEHKRLKRDVVMEWQPNRDTAFIADPFFRFRVKFGPSIV